MFEVNEKRLKELEAIRAKHGGILKPEAVVEFARSPETALHSVFEWNDSAAAEKHRLDQARTIIRVMVAPVAGSEELVRVNVSLIDDRKEPGGGYRKLSDVMTDPALRKKLLKTALIELVSARHRYEKFTELDRVFKAIDRADKELSPKLEDKAA